MQSMDDQAGMAEARDPLLRLQDLCHFFAGAAGCSIMLLGSAAGEEARMSVVARHGRLLRRMWRAFLRVLSIAN